MSDTLTGWEAWRREVEGPFTHTLSGGEWQLIGRALWEWALELRTQGFPDKAQQVEALHSKLAGN